jgi:hypothetical protein
MKRALSIASVALVAAFVAGAMFLLPATLPPEVIERSVVREQTMLEKAWHLPVASARPPRGLPIEPVLMRAGKHC